MDIVVVRATYRVEVSTDAHLSAPLEATVKYIHHQCHWNDELKAAAERAAAEGRTVSDILCPACDGGRRRRRSVSVWVSGGYYVANCWRNSCDYNGEVPIDPSVKIAVPNFKPRPFRGALEPIEDNTFVYQMLNTTLGIARETLNEFNVQAVLGSDAAYMPVYGPYFPNDRGATLRYYDGSEPKSVTYKCTIQPWLAWYSYPGADIVLVEDQASAMRLWQIGVTGVALMGTSISNDKAEEIKMMAGTVRRVHLCLDADATDKTVGYLKRFPWMVGHRLTKDFKNDTDENIRETIGA